MTALATDYRRRNLDRGNTVRLKRGELKAQITRGEIALADVLRDPPWFMQDMRVLDLLEVGHGIGPLWLRQLNMRAARHEWPPINLLAPLGELSERKKDWLISQVEPHLRRRAA